MKKALIIVCMMIANNVFSQSEELKSNESNPIIANAEVLLGLGGIHDEESTGGIGLGFGAWLPFKQGFIDLGLDFTTSASRNHGSLQFIYDHPFSIIEDEKTELKGYVGAGLSFGRIFNNQDYFLNHFPFGPVKDYNTGGFLANIGLEFKPVSANYAFYLDTKTGIISVPGWDDELTTPFKISLGCRFLLDNSK